MKIEQVNSRKRKATKATIPQESKLAKIKVRLDLKTVVIINRMSSFEVWRGLYPGAKIID